MEANIKRVYFLGQSNVAHVILKITHNGKRKNLVQNLAQCELEKIVYSLQASVVSFVELKY